MTGKKKKHRLLRAAGGLILAAVLCYGLLIGFVVLRESGVEKEAAGLDGAYDALIVLGAQVLPSGEPNTQLKWRLDAALGAWQARPVPIVVCGAQGRDEPVPEAVAMRDYLTARGVPEGEIYLDPDSFNTRENLVNAARILEGLPEVRRVAVVTSDYHVPRAMALAEDLGFEAAGLGAPCKPEYWIKNHAREALAWIKYWMNKYLHVAV